MCTESASCFHQEMMIETYFGDTHSAREAAPKARLGCCRRRAGATVFAEDLCRQLLGLALLAAWNSRC